MLRNGDMAMLRDGDMAMLRDGDMAILPTVKSLNETVEQIKKWYIHVEQM